MCEKEDEFKEALELSRQRINHEVELIKSRKLPSCKNPLEFMDSLVTELVYEQECYSKKISLSTQQKENLK